MSRYSEKIAKKMHGLYRVADLQEMPRHEITHTISYLMEDVVMWDEAKDILCFDDTGRQLDVNVTNANVLMQLFGDDPEKWAGQRVTLYLGTYGRDNKSCIRLRGVGDVITQHNGSGKAQAAIPATPAMPV